MKNWLYLTAEGLADLSSDWPCCLWSHTSERLTMPLHQAAQVLHGQKINLLLPIESCSWLRSEPWPGRRAPAAQALAFAVEEQLGEALDRVHLSVGRADAERRYPLIVIARERLAAVLSLLTENGLHVRSVFVDADLLPTDQPIATRWFGRWLLGGALPARLALTEEDLLALKSVLPEDMLWRDEPDEQAWLAEGFRQAINLRHGEFAPRNSPLPWRTLSAVVLILLLLGAGASETRIRFLDGETRRLAQVNDQRFKTLYPQHAQIVGLTAQIEAIQSVPAQSRETRIAALVRLVEQVIGASQVEVRRIEYEQANGWKVQLTANSFAELERLRERGRQQGLTIRIDGASKMLDRVTATLTWEDDV
ncbi:type II secretion system protein GspL [Pseudomonas sp. GM30]|uniref:type II secretion system protein GspL n=1 Tax=Pseudomonas sp. GM30 TaxID=1144328 RepID=UPI00026FEA99|nr:type II secretion system protein GspL [Pseudomonas sp. GM30]EUB84266.1 GspL, cytoplasmic actin-ATPase-like domain containing protein [Pseudomonas sp. GM30]